MAKDYLTDEATGEPYVEDAKGKWRVDICTGKKFAKGATREKDDRVFIKYKENESPSKWTGFMKEYWRVPYVRQKVDAKIRINPKTGQPLRRGKYKGKKIVPNEWMKEMIIPSPNSDYYGYQIWLGSSYIPLKPMSLIYDKDDNPPLYLADDMITFAGFGGQRVWISPKNELIVVYATKKWSNAWDEAKVPNIILQSLQS